LAEIARLKQNSATLTNLATEMAPKSWQQIFQKLRRINRREFLDRSRQELSKRSDSVLARFGYDFAKQTRLSTPGQPGAPERPHLALGGGQRGVFFFQPQKIENLLQIIRQRLPEQAEDIVRRANKICSHHFDLLGYQDLDYGEQVNWHLDAVHWKTAPRKPFHRIKYLDFAEVGDSKITWELNRHQHLVTLGKAYRLTGNDRFAEEIVSQWRSWHAQNPYPIGINWASSLEVAFRSLSWIWTHALLEGTRFLTGEFHCEYLRAQALNGRHIECYLSTYFSANTHLLGEGVALFFLGTLCRELKGAEGWRSRGWQIVLEQAERQVNTDGLHFEQSTYYHVYALDFFLHAALLATANGLDLPANFQQTLERMMNALYLLGRAGPPPRFGDDDGGRVFDPVRNRDEHLLDPLATGAVLFGRGDFKALCRSLREETIWLLGELGVAEWDRLESKPVPISSAALESSGIFLLAAPASGSQLVLKSGPAIAQSGGHSHADAMSVCLQSCGHTLLIDPGAYVYVGDGGERNLYRGTGMHNTLMVDGQDQVEPAGPFTWKQEKRSHTEQWIAGQTFDLFMGRHSGYCRLLHPVQHRRWIVALKSGIFLVRDLVEGEGEHHVEVSWHLAPDLQMQQEQLFRFNQSSQGLALQRPQSHGWSEEVHKSVWSPVYGVQRETTLLKFGKVCRLPADFVTLLVPLPDAAGIPGKFVRLSLRETTEFVRAYRYQANEVEHNFFFGQSREPWSCGPVASDAELVFLTTRRPSQVVDATLCNGSYVELEGKRVLAASHPVAQVELVNSETVQVFCSDPHAITKSSMPSSKKIPG